MLEAAPISGQKHRKIVAEFYDNSLNNIGNGNSFVYYGPRWAQASTAPSRMYKGGVLHDGSVLMALRLDNRGRHPMPLYRSISPLANGFWSRQDFPRLYDSHGYLVSSFIRTNTR